VEYGMEFKDCIKFATKTPASYVAKVEGDQPRVRGFLIWYADKTGIVKTDKTRLMISLDVKKNCFLFGSLRGYADGP
jgi:uncharacterized pyridoxamine 5'-phosphate oxidase family protein